MSEGDQKAEQQLMHLHQEEPTNPEYIVKLKLSLQYIPALPYYELYNINVDNINVVRSSAFRCISSLISEQLSEEEDIVFGPVEHYFRCLACISLNEHGLFGALSREKHEFSGYSKDGETKLLTQMLRDVSDNIRILELAHDYVPEQFIEVLTLLDLEEVCLRLPCEKSFLAMIKYLDGLQLESFNLVEAFKSVEIYDKAISRQELLQHIELFEQQVFPTLNIKQLTVYFKNLASNILVKTQPWLDQNFQLLHKNIDSNESLLEKTLLLFKEDILPENFIKEEEITQQLFVNDKMNYLEFILRVFEENKKFEEFQSEVYSEIFEEQISFIEDNEENMRNVTVYLLLASKFCYILQKQNKRYSFVYDKVIRNLQIDRQTLQDLQVSCNEIDYVILNLQKYLQSELLLQMQPYRQQKSFWLILKELEMHGIQNLSDEDLKRLDNDIFKGLSNNQNYVGLLGKVDCRIDIQQQNYQFDTSRLKKYYFQCNRFEGDEVEQEQSAIEKLCSIIGLTIRLNDGQGGQV